MHSYDECIFLEESRIIYILSICLLGSISKDRIQQEYLLLPHFSFWFSESPIIIWWDFLWYLCEHPCICSDSAYPDSLISSLIILWYDYYIYWFSQCSEWFRVMLLSLRLCVLLSMSRYVDGSRYSVSQHHVIQCVPILAIAVWQLRPVQQRSRVVPVSWVSRLHRLSEEMSISTDVGHPQGIVGSLVWGSVCVPGSLECVSSISHQWWCLVYSVCSRRSVCRRDSQGGVSHGVLSMEGLQDGTTPQDRPIVSSSSRLGLPILQPMDLR